MPATDSIPAELHCRYHGLPVVLTEFAGKKIEHRRRRSWTERLFARPWQPHVAEKVWSTWEPTGAAYIVEGRLHIHPADWDLVRRQLDRAGAPR
jgi:hypothetical protein